MRNSFFTLLLLCTYLSVVFGQNSSAITSINTYIQDLQKDTMLEGASWSFQLYYPELDSVLVDYNSNLSLLPASCHKLVTTATALELLGANYQYKTPILLDGAIDSNGTLHGNVIVRGVGDPTLGSDQFPNYNSLVTIQRKLKQAIQARGIKNIKGQLIIDASQWPHEPIPMSWQYEDIGNYYATSTSPIMLHDGKTKLTFDLATLTDTPKLSAVYPIVQGVHWKNEVTKSSDNSTKTFVTVLGGPEQYNRIVQGSISNRKRTYSIKASVPNIPNQAAYLFKKWLQESGVSIEQGARVSYDSMAGSVKDTLLVFTSPRLPEIIEVVNHKSDNLYAEQLLKTIGYAVNSEGTVQGGTEAILNYWKGKGIDMKGYKAYDGSGLSRLNVATTYQYNMLLAHMLYSNNFNTYHQSMATPGDQQGTLYWLTSDAYNLKKLKAKTGSLTGVRSLSGYVKAANGKTLTFSVMVNNYWGSKRQLDNRLGTLLKKIATL